MQGEKGGQLFIIKLFRGVVTLTIKLLVAPIGYYREEIIYHSSSDHFANFRGAG